MEYENIIEKNDIEEIILASDENGETIVVEEIGGSTSGGTNNYNDLLFKPKINGVELQGNKTSRELNINAETIEFTDGETFQEKYNNGELKGDTGKNGTNGTNGKDGVTPTLKVGTTTTGEAGTNANVTMNQNGTEYTLNFTIPKGKDGTGGSGGDVDLTDYVKKTDIAKSSEVGVVKANGSGGITVNSAGNISVVKATNNDIDGKTNNYKAIVPSNLEYAVKSVGDGYYATKSEVEALFNSITNGNEVSY